VNLEKLTKHRKHFYSPFFITFCPLKIIEGFNTVPSAQMVMIAVTFSCSALPRACCVWCLCNQSCARCPDLRAETHSHPLHRYFQAEFQYPQYALSPYQTKASHLWNLKPDPSEYPMACCSAFAIRHNTLLEIVNPIMA